MPLSSGTRLGPYEIVAAIGAGGMGEVYRGRDMRLQRDVAVKVLPAAFSTDRNRLARFEREARALASLNHPNVAAIYGVEDVSGVPALILELVEGLTLAERMQAGPLRQAEALRIARQIAAGLEAAHDRGIVHRDLKPANVKIAPDGSVKILDFGIAKTMESDAAVTRTVNQTGEGVAVGTPAYMSPEQLRGGLVDKRTDIWAFGCLLFELLAGRHPFAAATVPDTIARIVDREPDWQTLTTDVPASIWTLMRRCLQKDPAERLHDIADARIELAEVIAGPERPRTAPGAGPTRRLAWIAVAAVIGFAAVGAAVWLASRKTARPAAEPASIEFGLRFAPEYRPSTGIAVSPDGRYIVSALFGDVPQLWLTSLDSSESHPIAGTESGGQPFWSADALQIGFIRRGKLVRIPRAGGPTTDICDVTGIVGQTWNRQNVILFSTGRSFMQVPASGGAPHEVPITVDPGAALGVVKFLPDGRHFLFAVRRGTTRELRIGSLDDPAKTTSVLNSQSFTTFVEPDYLLFVRGAALVARRIDMNTFQPIGEEKTLVANVLSGNYAQNPSFSASRSVLAYVTPFAGEHGQLTWFDRTGARLDSIPSPPDGEYLNPSISPNGGSVALNRMDPQTGTWDVWIWNRARGFASRLTTDPADDSDAVWSADGKQVVFMSNRGGRFGFYRRSADGSGTDERLIDMAGQAAIMGDWSRDGRYILFSKPAATSANQVWAATLGSAPPAMPSFEDAVMAYAPRLSPDGRWIAYTSLSSGSLEVHVRRFMAEGEHVQISHGGGLHARWIANGKGLAFSKIGGGIAAVDLEFDASGIRVGPERLVVSLPVATLNDNRSHYDVTRDGQRFLVRQSAGAPRAPVNVVVNWTQRLKMTTAL